MRSLARDCAASKVKRRERRAARVPFTQSQPYEVSRSRLRCKERQLVAESAQDTSQDNRPATKMATRRITTQEKTHLDQDEVATQGKSNIAPAVPKYAHLFDSLYEIINADTSYFREVIIKLLLFTFAMIILPIGSYFVTLNTIYGGEIILPPYSTLLRNISADTHRQFNVGRRDCSCHGKRRSSRLRHCCYERRPVRSFRGRGEGTDQEVVIG